MMTSIHLILDTAETVGEPRTGGRRFWTGREEMILRAEYTRLGLAGVLEKLPGRSAQAIYEHARKIGVKSPREAKTTRRAPLGSNEQIDALIRRTCQNHPESGAIKRLAQTINRSRQWIRDQAIRLGCAVPRFKAPPWIAAEIEIIAENPHLGPLALKRRLRRAGFERTEVAIVSKLGLLGASMIDPDHYTANGLAKLFGIDVKVVTGWIAKGWLNARRRGTERTDLQGDQWWISRRQVRRFVVGSVQVIDFRKLDKVWLVDLLTDVSTLRLDRDEATAELSRSQAGWVPPKRLVDRLSQELALEDAREESHWLNDLDEDDTARVFVEMRRQNLKTKQPHAVPMEAGVRRDFLAAVRTGSTPEDAADIAKERHPETCHKIADLLAASMRAALVPMAMTG